MKTPALPDVRPPVSLTDARLAPYLELMRLPGTLFVWSNILAAHWVAAGAAAAAGTATGVQWLLLLVHLAVSAALYWSGSVLYDCFERARHAEERPERPIPSGRVPLRAAWAFGVGLMVLGLALAALAGGVTLRAAAALAVAIVAYVGFLKAGMLGPVTLGACRWSNWSLGLAVAGAPAGTAGLAGLALPVLLYTVSGAILAGGRKAGADRSTRRLFLTAFGLAVLALAGLWVSGQLQETWMLAGLGLALLAVLPGVLRLLRDGDPAAVRGLLRRLAMGGIVLDALLVFGSGYPVGAVLVLLLLVPAWLVERRLAGLDRHSGPSGAPIA